MKKIKSFADWNLVNEAKLYYLSQFGKALDNAPEEFKGIVKDLKDMWGKESGLDMTMFELDGDMLTYTSGRNIDPNFSPSVDDINRYEKQLLSGNRSLLKIGRLLNNTINKPKKYPESLINRFVVYLQSSSKDAEWTIKLVKGDAVETIPDFLNKNPQLVVAMLYLDFDVFKPTKIALELLFKRIPKGGLIVFDELNNEMWPGETAALNEVILFYLSLDAIWETVFLQSYALRVTRPQIDAVAFWKSRNKWFPTCIEDLQQIMIIFSQNR